MKKSILLILGIVAVLVVSGCVQANKVGLELCLGNIDNINDLEYNTAEIKISNSYSKEYDKDTITLSDGSTHYITYKFLAVLEYIDYDANSQMEIRIIKFNNPNEYQSYFTVFQEYVSDVDKRFEVQTSSSDFLGYEMMKIEIEGAKSRESFIYNNINIIKIPEINSLIQFGFDSSNRNKATKFLNEFINGICK